MRFKLGVFVRCVCEAFSTYSKLRDALVPGQCARICARMTRVWVNGLVTGQQVKRLVVIADQRGA